MNELQVYFAAVMLLFPIVVVVGLCVISSQLGKIQTELEKTYRGLCIISKQLHNATKHD